MVVSQIDVKSQFHLTDGAEVFAAEVHVIKEAISDAHRRGLGELDIYSDSGSALQPLYGLVPRHRAITEIKGLILKTRVVVHMHWVRAYVGHT